MWYFSFWLRSFPVVLVLDGFCPNASRYAPNNRIFGVYAIREKERQVRRKIIDIHTSTEIIFDIRKAVRQRKRQLRNGIGTCFRQYGSPK